MKPSFQRRWPFYSIICRNDSRDQRNFGRRKNTYLRVYIIDIYFFDRFKKQLKTIDRLSRKIRQVGRQTVGQILALCPPPSPRPLRNGLRWKWQRHSNDSNVHHQEEMLCDRVVRSSFMMTHTNNDKVHISDYRDITAVIASKVRPRVMRPFRVLAGHASSDYSRHTHSSFYHLSHESANDPRLP